MMQKAGCQLSRHGPGVAELPAGEPRILHEGNEGRESLLRLTWWQAKVASAVDVM